LDVISRALAAPARNISIATAPSASSKNFLSADDVEAVRQRCPLLAHSGHHAGESQCPLSEVKQTLRGPAAPPLPAAALVSRRTARMLCRARQAAGRARWLYGRPTGLM